MINLLVKGLDNEVKPNGLFDDKGVSSYSRIFVQNSDLELQESLFLRLVENKNLFQIFLSKVPLSKLS